MKSQASASTISAVHAMARGTTGSESPSAAVETTPAVQRSAAPAVYPTVIRLMNPTGFPSESAAILGDFGRVEEGGLKAVGDEGVAAETFVDGDLEPLGVAPREDGVPELVAGLEKGERDEERDERHGDGDDPAPAEEEEPE